jgi:cytoskeletal protein CcmA (bactofilin family)
LFFPPQNLLNSHNKKMTLFNKTALTLTLLLASNYAVDSVVASKTTALRNGKTNQQHQNQGNPTTTTTAQHSASRHLEDLLAKMDALRNDVIPSLLSKIDNLENQVDELQQHRQMAEVCGFSLTTEGVCQLEQPLELLFDLNVLGNVTLGADVAVQGSAIFAGDVEVSADLKVTGASQVVSLDVGSTLDVTGAASFESRLDASQDVRLSRNLQVSGRTSVKDLFVRDDLEVRGESTFLDNVKIEGDESELTVEGDVIFEDDLEVGGDTDFKGGVTVENELTVEGELIVKEAATFESDVEVEGEVTVDDLKVEGDCDGCV